MVPAKTLQADSVWVFLNPSRKTIKPKLYTLHLGGCNGVASHQEAPSCRHLLHCALLCNRTSLLNSRRDVRGIFSSTGSKCLQIFFERPCALLDLNSADPDVGSTSAAAASIKHQQSEAVHKGCTCRETCSALDHLWPPERQSCQSPGWSPALNTRRVLK